MWKVKTMYAYSNCIAVGYPVASRLPRVTVVAGKQDVKKFDSLAEFLQQKKPQRVRNGKRLADMLRMMDREDLTVTLKELLDHGANARAAARGILGDNLVSKAVEANGADALGAWVAQVAEVHRIGALLRTMITATVKNAETRKAALDLLDRVLYNEGRAMQAEMARRTDKPCDTAALEADQNTRFLVFREPHQVICAVVQDGRLACMRMHPPGGVTRAAIVAYLASALTRLKRAHSPAITSVSEYATPGEIRQLLSRKRK